MAKRKRKSSAYQLERQRYWQQMISKWRQSGLYQAAFCRSHKLDEQQFSKWKRQMSGISDSTPRPEAGDDFIEFKPSAPVRQVYEIVTPGNYRIRIEGDYHPDALAGILSVVSQSC